jgi:small subunit ribosomal protein S16
MVVIRLARGGNRNRPYFYIAVAESSARLKGRFIEKIGFHNPLAAGNAEAFRIDFERLSYWVSKGAQMSPAIKKLTKIHAPKQAS